MRHKKTINLLKDYFSTTDNVYVQHQLEILESEVEMSIMDAQIKVMNDNLNTIKQL
jgi:hypothetical protein